MTTDDPVDTERKKKPVLWNFPLSIVLIDHPGSGAPDADTLRKIAAAYTKSMAGDFAPFYQRLSTMRYDTSASPGELICGLFETADQPGALGYHDKNIIKVFPKLDAKDGSPLSATIDHEGKEATVDLTINLARTGVDGKFWADECADAVEQDTYTVDGITLSNFVTPSWYSGEDSRYDFCSRLKKPLTLTAGGYAQYFDPNQGWQQIVHQDKGPRSYRLRPEGRSHRRRMQIASHP